MQKAQADSAPGLLYVETKAGHGAGKPLQKTIAETADKYAFFSKALNIDTSNFPGP